MIDPKELRIGNLVCVGKKDNGTDEIGIVPTVNSEHYILYELGGDLSEVTFKEYDNLTNDSYYITEEYYPIPLNEKWLLCFGFKHYKGWLIKDAFSPGHPSQRFDLYWSDKDGFMVKSRYQEDNNGFKMRHIKTVHQLQNLYFSLTGEELEKVNNSVNKQNDDHATN